MNKNNDGIGNEWVVMYNVPVVTILRYALFIYTFATSFSLQCHYSLFIQSGSYSTGVVYQIQE